MKHTDLKTVIKVENTYHKIKIRVKQKRNGTYSVYLDTYTNYRHHYEFLNLFLFDDNQHAVHNDNVLRSVKYIRDKREASPYDTDAEFTFTQPVIASFADYMTVLISTKKRNTGKQYQNALNFWLKTFNHEDIPLAAITKGHIEKLVKALKSSHLGQTAQHHYLFGIKYALRQALKDEIIERNPAENYNIPPGQSQRLFLSLEDVKKVAALEGFKMRDPFLFSCFTGLRSSDIRALTWQDIKDDSVYIRQTKTDTMVMIPLSQSARDIVARQDKSSLTVFDVPGSRRMHHQVKDMIKAAGLSDKITFHIARHTFATLLLTYDVDIYTVSKLLGHSSVTTTQIYAKLIDSKRVEAVNKLPTI